LTVGSGLDLQGHTHPAHPGHAAHPGHDHDHQAGVGHTHASEPGPGPGPGPEANLGPSAEASVVLDIGPHAGALVLYTDEDLAGAEIEIRPGGAEWLGTHTAVRERHAASRILYAGVFGSLVPGTYDLRLKGGGPGSFGLTVEVVAGAVTEAKVPSTVPLSAAPAR
jgi:hypothetical protein